MYNFIYSFEINGKVYLYFLKVQSLSRIRTSNFSSGQVNLQRLLVLGQANIYNISTPLLNRICKIFIFFKIHFLFSSKTFLTITLTFLMFFIFLNTNNS